MGQRAKANRLSWIFAGLLLGIFIASMDDTIVATAMGTIVADLGGIDRFIWVTSAYMATQMAGMPIFGKLSDMYGRKRFFIFGLGVFLLGSVLCGTAQNIVQLSLFRALQGIGGGALMPIAFTIIWDVFPLELRAKLGGIFGAVFGLSSIAGPLIGAYLTDHVNWRWVFYINLPLGLIAFALILFGYHESSRHERQQIDAWGAGLLTLAVGSLMFALELGGTTYAWSSWQIVGLFLAFSACFLAFLWAETRAAEPIVSFAMFQNRLFAASCLAGLFYGAAFVVATVYIPIFIQGVMGGSATNSGLLLLPMLLGTTVAAPVGGQLSQRFSYRQIMLVSAIILGIGLTLLSTLTPSTPRFWLTVYMVVVGLGTGASFSVLGMSAIHHFGPAQRGQASSTANFLRMLGMTLGISVFGVIQRDDFQHRLNQAFSGLHWHLPPGVNLSDPHAMLTPALRAHIPAFVLNRLVPPLSQSIAHTFVFTLIPAVLALVCAAIMGPWKMTADAAGFAGPKGDKAPGDGNPGDTSPGRVAPMDGQPAPAHRHREKSDGGAGKPKLTAETVDLE
ncbi:MDR family MFS transporter [Alicyclobacillus herbarius]|uniref:MDR family MFS transporter n=1 Tax=Alicyclobacillus herbarius TaxID=122960 RepID=UPI00040DC3EA|nr:DHA2 family efflux MFS transporter permease subunit [Alicyclobacillus herbarius]